MQSALAGSILANVLLVLGVAFLSGGARYGIQTFRPEAPRMLVTLLTLAVGAMLVPTLAVHLETPAAHHSHALSDATAVILLLVYVASVPFWLSGGPTRGRHPERLLVRIIPVVLLIPAQAPTTRWHPRREPAEGPTGGLSAWR